MIKKIIFTLVLYFCFIKFNKIDISKIKKKIIGFQINGVGNGHITQAITVYNILIKYFEIPIVVIYGIKKNLQKYFSKSKICYENMYTTNECIDNLNMTSILWDIIRIKPTKKYEENYNVNLWINFFVTDFFNFRTKGITIGCQFSSPQLKFMALTRITQLLSDIKVVSIQEKNHYDKYTIPPLISNKLINRNNINPRIILAYSVSGKIFPKTLILLAKKYPNYKFKYFSLKHEYKYPKNITPYTPERSAFKKYQSVCGAILCTSGNELILECVYNNIPVATIPCNIQHFEQNFNFNKYVHKLNYAEVMSSKINLNKLISKNCVKIQKLLHKIISSRDKAILDLVNKK